MATANYTLSNTARFAVKGKTALVTGASGGIGLDFARALAQAGCNLILVARSSEKLEAIKKEIVENHQVNVEVMVEDLSKASAAKNLHQALKAHEISILINNAGAGLHGKFLDQNLNDALNLIHLNVDSLVKLSHLFGSDMMKRKEGYILQVASVAGFMPLPNYAVYAATKSFVLSFSQALNEELEGSGVSSTALCPGATRTNFFATAGHKTNKLVEKTMMTSGEVAAIGLEAMVRREDTAVAGMMNKVTVGLTTTLPRRITKRLTAEFMKKREEI